MEYAQMSMEEYIGMKKDIHESIGKIVKNFVRIGETLCRIDQSEAYRLDGYSSLAEFAEAEYGMKRSGVSRFTGVYRKYCERGNLKQEYEDYTYAQLVEMLNLSDEDEKLIRPETSREEIRDLKRFNREGENDVHALETWKESKEEEHRKYLKEMLTILFQKKDRENDFDEICKGVKTGDMTTEAFSEYVNPGGSKTIRNGRTMTFLFENEIRMKIWGEDIPAVFSYEQLYESFKEQFQVILEEKAEWWKKQFEEKSRGSDSEQKVEEQNPEEKPEPEKEKIAPAQKEQNIQTAKNLKDEKTVEDEEGEEKIPGQDTILNHPEFLPDDLQTSAQVDGEPVPAAVEKTEEEHKKECWILLKEIDEAMAYGKYEDALQASRELVKKLEKVVSE